LEHDVIEELPETVVAEDGFVVGETANAAFAVTTEESFTNLHHDVVQPLPASEVQGVDVSVGSSIGSSPAISGKKIVPGTPFSRPDGQHIHLIVWRFTFYNYFPYEGWGT